MLTPFILRRAVAAAAVAGVVLLGAAATAAAETPARAVPVTAGDLSGACTDPDGVTVVVDQTDLGGEVLVGCAEGAATGTEALVAAGFSDTRDASGLICAIDGLPDPCPETFEGSYWSYWYATPDGDWQTYLEGPDTAVPQPGALEGWRYSDGSAGPIVSPAEVVAGAPATEDEPADEATDEPAVEPAEEATDEPAVDEIVTIEDEATDDDATTSGLPAWAFVLIGVAVIGAVVAVGVGRARRSGDGPPGQD